MLVLASDSIKELCKPDKSIKIKYADPVSEGSGFSDEIWYATV